MKLKKLVAGALAVALSMQAGFAHTSKDSKVLHFDGQSREVNVVVKNGISLMEVRSFADAMGFGLDYAKNTKAIRMTDKTSAKSVAFVVDTKRAIVEENGSKSNKTSNHKTILIEGRTYVPARFLVETLGYNIELRGDEYYVADKDAVQMTNQSDKNTKINRPYTENDTKLIDVFIERAGAKKWEEKQKITLRAIPSGNGSIMYVDVAQFGDTFGHIYSAESPKYGIAKVTIKNIDTNKHVVAVFTEGVKEYQKTVGKAESTEHTRIVPVGVNGALFVSLNDLLDGLEMPYRYTASTNTLELR